MAFWLAVCQKAPKLMTLANRESWSGYSYPCLSVIIIINFAQWT